MSFASKHNRGQKFDIDTTGFEYKKLEEIQDKNDLEKIFVLRGLYINRKGKFGASPVAILDNCFVNLPSHLLEDVKAILTDADDVEDIRAGRVGFVVDEYDDKNFKKRCYSVQWRDIPA